MLFLQKLFIYSIFVKEIKKSQQIILRVLSQQQKKSKTTNKIRETPRKWLHNRHLTNVAYFQRFDNKKCNKKETMQRN